MRICILSMQRVDNMGSLLQAYALKRILERNGNCVEFLDIERRQKDFVLLGQRQKEFSSEKERSGLVGKLRKIDKYAFNRLRIRKRNHVQHEEFERFRSTVLKIERTSARYDLCVIGSDEVFNCLSAGWWGFTAQLFGDVPQAERVITYAASCGSTKYEDLPNAVALRIKESFEKVDGFSVRDKNTYEFVSQLTDKQIDENLDPVLIYDFDREVQAAQLPPMPKRYCVIYSYYNRIHTTEEVNAINSFCQRNGLTPVAVGAPQFWVKDYVVCSPFQCLKIFQNAEFVITDTFHGTIFSAKHAGRFAVLVRESNRNKLADLMDKLKIKQHWMNDVSELDDVYGRTHPKEAFNATLAAEQEKAFEYLGRHCVK